MVQLILINADIKNVTKNTYFILLDVSDNTLISDINAAMSKKYNEQLELVSFFSEMLIPASYDQPIIGWVNSLKVLMFGQTKRSIMGFRKSNRPLEALAALEISEGTIKKKIMGKIYHRKQKIEQPSKGNRRTPRYNTVYPGTVPYDVTPIVTSKPDRVQRTQTPGVFAPPSFQQTQTTTPFTSSNDKKSNLDILEMALQNTAASENTTSNVVPTNPFAIQTNPHRTSFGAGTSIFNASGVSANPFAI